MCNLSEVSVEKKMKESTINHQKIAEAEDINEH